MHKKSRLDIPVKLKEVYFDFHWDQNKLWAFELPTEEMKIEELVWSIDFPIWSSISTEHLFDLCPRDVYKELDSYPIHRKRIANSDPDLYPIHVMNWKGRWLIIDGYHRLLKLMLRGDEFIKVKKVPVSAIPEISPDSNL